MNGPDEEYLMDEIDGGGGQQLIRENKKKVQTSWNKMIETLKTVNVPITQEERTNVGSDVNAFLGYGIKSSTFIDLQVPLSDKDLDKYKFGLNTGTINNEKIGIIRNLTIRYCSVAVALLINYNIPADVWYLQTNKACSEFSCTEDYILINNSRVKRDALNDSLIMTLNGIGTTEFNVKYPTYVAVLVKYFYLVIVNNNKLQKIWESFISTVGTNVLSVSIRSANLIKNKAARQPVSNPEEALQKKLLDTLLEQDRIFNPNKYGNVSSPIPYSNVSDEVINQIIGQVWINSICLYTTHCYDMKSTADYPNFKGRNADFIGKIISFVREYNESTIDSICQSVIDQSTKIRNIDLGNLNAAKMINNDEYFKQISGVLNSTLYGYYLVDLTDDDAKNGDETYVNYFRSNSSSDGIDAYIKWCAFKKCSDDYFGNYDRTESVKTSGVFIDTLFGCVDTVFKDVNSRITTNGEVKQPDDEIPASDTDFDVIADVEDEEPPAAPETADDGSDEEEETPVAPAPADDGIDEEITEPEPEEEESKDDDEEETPLAPGPADDGSDEARGGPTSDDVDWNDLIYFFDIPHFSDGDDLLQKVQQNFHIVISTQILNKINAQNLSYVWVMSTYASVGMINRTERTSMPLPEVAEVTDKMNAIFTDLPTVTEYQGRYTAVIEQLTAFLEEFFDDARYAGLLNNDAFFNYINLYASSITNQIITAPPAILPATNPRDLPYSIASNNAKINAIIDNYFSLTLTYQIHYNFSNEQITRIWSTAINTGCAASGMFCGTDSARLITNYLAGSLVSGPAHLRQHTIMEALKGIIVTPLLELLSEGKIMLDVDNAVKTINSEAFKLTTEETTGTPSSSLPPMPMAPTTPLPFPTPTTADEEVEEEKGEEPDEELPELESPTLELPVNPPPYNSLPPSSSPTSSTASTPLVPTTTEPDTKNTAAGPGTLSKVIGTIYPYSQQIIFGLIVLLGIISTIVLFYTGNPVQKKPDAGISVPTPPAPIVENTEYTRQMVNDGIAETTRLNNSYNILYDNKKVDYRHSYYKNLSITLMQKWEPYLFRIYVVVMIVYLVALLAFQHNRPVTEKIKSFIGVAVITNVYVLKILLSALFLLYTKLNVIVPKLFMY